MKIILALCLLCSVAQAVVNGTVVDPSHGLLDKDILNSVVLLYNYNAMSICTGSIISDRVIVTAAHCLQEAGPEDMGVFYGYFNLKASVKKQRSAKILMYSQYAAEASKDNILNSYDIGLIFMDKKIPASSQPARILPSMPQLNKNSQIVVAGFGDTDNKKDTENTLRRRSVKFEKLDASKDLFVFDQNDGGMCTGDSGGPTYFIQGDLNYLIGVNSKVGGTGVLSPFKHRCKQNAYVTNIYPYLDWIQAEIKKWK